MRVAPMTSRFLDACRRRPTDVRPVWFMRQAGRYMRQYRQIREKHGILEICKRPDLAATVTLQPIEILDVDAAIIFADLLLPIEPMGLKLKYEKGEGPVGDSAGYRPLIVEIVKFFRTKQPPVAEAETLEIYAFMEAADESKRRGGEPVELEEMMTRAKPLAATRLAGLGVK